MIPYHWVQPISNAIYFLLYLIRNRASTVLWNSDNIPLKNNNQWVVRYHCNWNNDFANKLLVFKQMLWQIPIGKTRIISRIIDINNSRLWIHKYIDLWRAPLELRIEFFRANTRYDRHSSMHNNNRRIDSHRGSTGTTHTVNTLYTYTYQCKKIIIIQYRNFW